jgi:hypothetical protein
LAGVRFVHQHSDYISSADSGRYVAQVYAGERTDHSWEAWLVFFPYKGDEFVTTDPETTQSSFDAVRYWASGLTHRYYEAALEHALARTDDVAGERPVSDDERLKKAEAYALAAEQARERAHELQVMQRAMRRGIRFG